MIIKINYTAINMDLVSMIKCSSVKGEPALCFYNEERIFSHKAPADICEKLLDRILEEYADGCFKVFDLVKEERMLCESETE